MFVFIIFLNVLFPRPSKIAFAGKQFVTLFKKDLKNVTTVCKRF